MRFAWLLYCLLVVGALVPVMASAHEVYVLSPQVIQTDLTTPSPNPLDAFWDHQTQFYLWAFIGFVLVSTVFFASVTHKLEEFFESYLTPLKKWAPFVARITLGVCLVATAYNHALFGPELPLHDFGQYAVYLEYILYLAGVLVLVGVGARIGAALAMLVFLCGAVLYGSYMLNYANYLGEMLAIFLLSGWVGLPKRVHPNVEALAFLLLRIPFGISVAFASFYAKFLHSNLALSTISEYHLTNFFHFDPLFIVLGACLIEVVMGIFFILGFEIRHTALFFLFWLTMSLLYFGEAVWPHLLLFGVNAALFMYGYDKWSIEGRLFNRGRFQPFL